MKAALLSGSLLLLTAAALFISGEPLPSQHSSSQPSAAVNARVLTSGPIDSPSEGEAFEISGGGIIWGLPLSSDNPPDDKKRIYRRLKATPAEVNAYLNELLAEEARFPAHYQAHLQAEAKIRKALTRRIDIAFKDMPLADALKDLGEILEINIRLDSVILEEAQIDTNEAVNFTASGMMARSVLDWILWQLEIPLAWTIDKESLIITTLEEHDARLTPKIHNVTDLIIRRNDRAEIVFDDEPLIDAIKDGVDESALWIWESEGGNIASFRSAESYFLIIRQTQQVHDQIEVILAGLRRMRRREPVIFKKVKIKMIPGRHTAGGGFF